MTTNTAYIPLPMYYNTAPECAIPVGTRVQLGKASTYSRPLVGVVLGAPALTKADDDEPYVAVYAEGNPVGYEEEHWPLSQLTVLEVQS